MGYETLFKWRGEPLATGEVKEIKVFKQLIKESNLEAFRTLMVQLAKLDDKDFDVTKYDSEDALEEVYDRSCDDEFDKLIGYYVDGKLAGCCSVHTWGNKRKKVFNCYISDVAVHPEYESQGIATQLINWVVAKHPKHEISLHVHYENTRAFDLYTRLGFKAKFTSMELDR